jgi:SAM-dependent methyltransferase
MRVLGFRNRLLDVRAPHRRNVRRLVGDRAVLHVGCGTGRTLARLGADSVGVDHSPRAVARCRARGLTAYTPDQFRASAHGAPRSFDGLVASHLVGQLDRPAGLEMIGSYLPSLRAGAVVVVITPQERGYACDADHVRFCDFDEVARMCDTLGFTVRSHASFPFPRQAGRLYSYNEFVTVASVD